MNNSHRTRKLLEMVAIAFLCVSTAYAAFDAFLKIDGIPGEATDSMHKEWIDVLSFSWGVSQAITNVRPGVQQGKSTVQELTITKVLDTASPKLYEACLTGKHLPTVTLVLDRVSSGESRAHMEFLKVVLTNVLVSSVKTMGDIAVDKPTERVSLNFTKIQWTYTQFDPSTSEPISTIISGWDVLRNRVLPTPTPTPTPPPIPTTKR